jgi:ankyrin repeat protein
MGAEQSQPQPDEALQSTSKRPPDGIESAEVSLSSCDAEKAETQGAARQVSEEPSAGSTAPTGEGGETHDLAPTGPPLDCGSAERSPSISSEGDSAERQTAALPVVSLLSTASLKRASSPTQTASSTWRGMLSWRPASFRGVGARKKRVHHDPKRVFEGLDGLSLMCALGETGQVRTLLAGGHAPDRRDADGDRVPLHWAAARGEIKCIEMLLKVRARMPPPFAAASAASGRARAHTPRAAQTLPPAHT